MLHRILFTFSLIVAFGFGQIGALSHQIGHDIAHINVLSASLNGGDNLSDASKSAPTKSVPDHKLCEQCVGFSGLSHAYHTSGFSFAVVQSRHSTFTQTAFFTARLKSLSRSARAPPFSLV